MFYYTSFQFDVDFCVVLPIFSPFPCELISLAQQPVYKHLSSSRSKHEIAIGISAKFAHKVRQNPLSKQLTDFYRSNLKISLFLYCRLGQMEWLLDLKFLK